MPKPKNKILEVHLFEAKPNPMFPSWLTERLRFLRYSQPVKCAYCGRLNRHHWTLLLGFFIAEGFEKKLGGKLVTNQRVVECQSFHLTRGKELFAPLTPVCRKHIMKPAV